MLDKLAVDGAVDWHDGIAKNFADGYDRSPAFRERATVWNAAIDNAVRPGDAVLDAGCGSGIFSFMAASKAGSVMGIDGSAKMIELCNGAKATNGLNNTEFRQAMLDELAGYPAESYDVILSSSVLEYVEGFEGVLDHIARLLKPGGRLLISMPNARSLYRHVERIAYRVTGKPAYYAHVRNVVTVDSFGARLKARGFAIQDITFFADPPKPFGALSAAISEKRNKTLFLVSATKS